MDRKEIVNSQDYKATKAAIEWWYSLPEEQRKATDIDAEPDIVDAYAEGVIYGWNNPQWIPVKKTNNTISVFFRKEQDGWHTYTQYGIDLPTSTAIEFGEHIAKAVNLLNGKEVTNG